MLVKLNTRVISEQQRRSQKTGNTYRVINFMDGDNVVNAMCKNECTTSIVPFENYILTLDVNIRFGSFKIVEIERDV